MSIPNYCAPCGENLPPEQTECPFCGQMAVPVDERVTELVHELRYVESVYRRGNSQRQNDARAFAARLLDAARRGGAQ